MHFVVPATVIFLQDSRMQKRDTVRSECTNAVVILLVIRRHGSAFGCGNVATGETEMARWRVCERTITRAASMPCLSVNDAPGAWQASSESTSQIHLPVHAMLPISTGVANYWYNAPCMRSAQTWVYSSNVRTFGISSNTSFHQYRYDPPPQYRIQLAEAVLQSVL